MSISPSHLPIERLACPLPEAQARVLVWFWASIFEEPFDYLLPVLTGVERAFNHDTVYLARAGETIAATCRLTVCAADARFGLLGEVATDPGFRGQGLGHRVCTQARDDFASSCGLANFLATSNPAARNLYESLGWRRLANANVMAWFAPAVTAGDPNTTIHRLLPPTQRGDAFRIERGSPALRATMVPFIAHDHPWRVLDANAFMYSTRHVLQSSCEGLYTRYRNLEQHGGTWFAALAGAARVIGLASATPIADSPDLAWRVDAFAEHARADVWDALIKQAVAHAQVAGTRRCEVITGEDDGEKRLWLIEEGFADAGPAAPRDVHGVTILTRMYSRSPA